MRKCKSISLQGKYGIREPAKYEENSPYLHLMYEIFKIKFAAPPIILVSQCSSKESQHKKLVASACIPMGKKFFRKNCKYNSVGLTGETTDGSRSEAGKLTMLGSGSVCGDGEKLPKSNNISN